LLVQSERFGTSIGESLRVQSDTLRVKRQQRAEEAAAKISVKLVFPLVLCILPSIFLVVGGPAVIQISKSFGALFGAT
jgi:tight adherence protein C